MYRSCIFCSADLKANDALERFPVGRSIAFDGEKGRLWAVCAACARWNLAPLEERWEAVEDAERLFRDTRTRAQSENIGIARLRDGTRLIRVGAAVGGELAAWRYGGQIASRRLRYSLVAGAASIALGGVLAAGAAAAGAAMMGGALASTATAIVRSSRRAALDRRLVHQACTGDPLRDRPVRVLGKHVRKARLRLDGGGAVELYLPEAIAGGAGAHRVQDVSSRDWVLRGGEARLALGRGMVVVNAAGGTRRKVRDAVDCIQRNGGPERLLLAAAGRELRLDGSRVRPPGAEGAAWEPACPITGRPQRTYAPERPDPLVALALEMSVHDEMEREALRGELAGLQEMWRQAEEIAAIADRLPELPAADAPRT
jgi:hypothetical protein